MARIAAAKAYKQSGATGSSASTSSASSSSTSSSGEADSSVSEEQQEAMRQQYLQQLREQQASVASQSSEYSAYIQQTSQQQQQQPAADAANALDRLQQEDVTPGERAAPARPDFYTNPEVPSVQQLMSTAPKKSGAGSADEAAEWLKGVLQERPDQPQFDPGMRLEEFTAAKEAAMRQRGAEIITAFPEDFQPSAPAAGDIATAEAAAAAAAAGGGIAAAPGAVDSSGEEGDKYKPKVTTWGVFPRPSNISQAFGGGRNIRPGQELETPEQRAQRQAEYAAALQRFKAATFVDSLSDEELAAAQQGFDRGMALFKRGALQDALALFDEALPGRGKVPLKSKLGGLSTLQAAVCYDTLGNARQAEALYKRIQGHPTTEVSRKAKALVFGFQAMTFLKTENISYAVKKDEYLKYFRRGADRNRMYVPSEEERAADQAEASKAAVVALAVVLGPVVVMAALLAGARLYLL
ncbi:hypothetical protein COO60DRAFT_1646775 [Scenedesmus sp. NREL 46B-D3]|nr:hypothetical protein COO60DRAFT_1646775 [Scenedesmus sp. NREL 46B-D3]